MQFGFRGGHSTSHAATALVEYIYNAFEKKEYAIGIFLDLSKAFDTIDHNILFTKLHKYGIRGSALNWFKSYLSNRTQQVQCGGVLSSSQHVIHCVPQGSILGPLLFLIYVNDLPNCLQNGQTMMFADDTTILFSSNNYKTLFDDANKELIGLDNWLISNKLSLNITKTKYVLFRTPSSKDPPFDASLTIRNKKIIKTSSIKYLGLTIQENLSWKLHMETIIGKLRACTGVVRRVKHLFDHKTLLLLYHSLIRCHTNYCITTWCNGNKSLVSKIQRQENKFIRLVFGLKNTDSVKNILQHEKLLSVEQTFFTETALFMHRYKTITSLPKAFENATKF